ncbi:hypothetical protein BS50DRAFT_628164 [Corynespora cassiicola Philippines]|uniref:Uncharacterized protein n=1 Tax=Corynespora cassiicola Philippines TaxID=1448308 RepID=A0A2T2PC12_CORCC|nr:hypothetical protein BS50DRAFT_628164 [Corynespora cassiicola Philippines]
MDDVVDMYNLHISRMAGEKCIPGDRGKILQRGLMVESSDTKAAVPQDEPKTSRSTEEYDSSSAMHSVPPPDFKSLGGGGQPNCPKDCSGPLIADQGRRRLHRGTSSSSRGIRVYAALSCHILCQKVESAFPREIRDLIYEAIIARNSLSIEVGPHTTWPPALLLRTLPPSQQQDPPGVMSGPYHHHHRGYTHCWDPDFVPLSMMRELAESWYRRATFSLTDGATVAHLLRTEGMRFALDPGALIRHVRIRIRRSEMVPRSEEAEGGGGGGLDAVATVGSIFGLDAARVSVTLYFWGCFSICSIGNRYARIFALQQDVPKLFPVLEQLKRSGYRITLSFDGCNEMRIADMELTDPEWWQGKVAQMNRAMSSM